MSGDGFDWDDIGNLDGDLATGIREEMDAIEVTVYEIEIVKIEGEDIETRGINMIPQDGFVMVIKPVGLNGAGQGVLGQMVAQSPVEMYVSHLVSMENIEEATCEPVEDKTIHPEEGSEGPGIDL